MAVINWGTVKNALADWVTAVLPTAGIHWAGQDAARPAYPYVLLDIVGGPVAVHHDSTHVLGDGNDIRRAIRGDREVTFSVEVIVSFEGAAYSHANDAFALAEELRSSLSRDEIHEALRAAGVAILDPRGAITNRRTALDGGFLSRAGFDVLTGLAASYVPATSETAIERVLAESTISNHSSTDYYGGEDDPTPL